MPSVDFRAVRAAIPIAKVLDLVGFETKEASGDQVRGGCPVHGSSSLKSRSFSVNLVKNTYRCFHCGSQGNQLDLWAAAAKTPLYEATIALCETLKVEAPTLQNPQSQPRRFNDERRESEKRNP